MKKEVMFLILYLMVNNMYSQIGIGTVTPTNSSILDVHSSFKGFLPPRMNSIQRDLINGGNPAAGLVIYNTDDKCLNFFDGTSWQNPCASNLNITTNGTSNFTITNCSFSSAGSLVQGEAITPGTVTQTIQIDAAQLGSYSLSAEANNVTFSKDGNITTTGLQTIVLEAVGTPTASGNHSFTLNITGGCSFNRNVLVPILPLPTGVTMTSGKRKFIASVFDTDYLPYTNPTSAATTAIVSPPGGPVSQTVDLQGILTTSGVTIEIPYSSSSAVTLPQFSQTRTIIPDHIQGGGIARQVELSYSSQPISPGTGTINATIRAIGSSINIKKLDINAGLGNDYKGITLAQFDIATSSAVGSTGPIYLHAIPGIPDRKFGDGEHDFLYLPVADNNGNVWLNNNLGADYANLNKPDTFNPGQQAISHNDIRSYGSLFQWGREADGHELIMHSTIIGGINAKAKYPAVSSFSSTLQVPAPNTKNFLKASAENWLFFGQTGSSGPDYDNLWQGGNGTNNPCPAGFKVPSQTEWTTYLSNHSVQDHSSAHSSVLKLPTAGWVNQGGGAISRGRDASYWTSTVGPLDHYSMLVTWYNTSYAASPNMSIVSWRRKHGFSIRCIQQ